MLAWPVLVPELRSLSCQWYVVKCIHPRGFPELDVSLFWESLHFDFLKNCFEMKFRGHQINKPSPKISLSIHFLFYSFYFPSNVMPSNTEILPSLLWLSAFLCPGGPGDMIWLRSRGNAMRTETSCYLWLSCGQCSLVTTLTLYFPLGRNYVSMIISNLSSRSSFGIL